MLITRFTLPVPVQRLDAIDRLARARTRSRNDQINVLIQFALNLTAERLPCPRPGESAADYHARLQRIADGGQ